MKHVLRCNLKKKSRLFSLHFSWCNLILFAAGRRHQVNSNRCQNVNNTRDRFLLINEIEDGDFVTQ